MRITLRHLGFLLILHGLISKAALSIPYHYFVFGDSMIKTGLGNAIKKKLQEKSQAPIRIFGKSSSGLSRPDTFDWQQAITHELNSAAHRDLVKAFVMIGTNDCQDIPSPSGAKKYGSEEWTIAYKERLLKFGQTLCKAATQVYWVGLPPMRSKKFNYKIKNLNQLVADTLKQETCILFIPTEKILGTASGEYIKNLMYQDKSRSIRESDGIHLSYDGAKILADNLFATYSIVPTDQSNNGI